MNRREFNVTNYAIIIENETGTIVQGQAQIATTDDNIRVLLFDTIEEVNIYIQQNNINIIINTNQEENIV